MEDNLPGLLLGNDWRRNKELHLDIYEETLFVTNIHWVVWEGDVVTICNSLKILGEGGEGRLNHQGKHA